MGTSVEFIPYLSSAIVPDAVAGRVRPGSRLTLGTLLAAIIPIAAYCALYAEVRSIKKYGSHNLDIYTNQVGLLAALSYLAVSNLLIGFHRRASATEFVVQLTATPCTGLLVHWATPQDDILPACYLGILAIFGLLAVVACCDVSHQGPRSRRPWIRVILLSLLIGSLSLGLAVPYEIRNVCLIIRMSFVWY